MNIADVIVVGAGNAALCAALSAQENGARVLVLEKAPEHMRGGNSYFTGGGFRFPYNGLEDIRGLIPEMADEEANSIEIGSYPQSQMYDDIMRVTEGLSDADLIETLVTRAYPTVQWMREQGLHWVLMYGRQSFEVGGKQHFYGGLITEAVGGGKGLVDSLFDAAQARGIDIAYGAKVTGLLTDDIGRVTGVSARTPEGSRDFEAGAVVLACGGFESNPEMRTRYLGPGWELAKVRGTRYNTGDGIRIGPGDRGPTPRPLEFLPRRRLGSQRTHFRRPQRCRPLPEALLPLGIVVNVEGKRFLDEGADLRNYTYAKYGREILKQPHRTAFQIFDAKVSGKLRDEYYIARATKAESDTIPGLADALGIDRQNFIDTVQSFNAAVTEGEFNPAVLDGKGTTGIEPPKSNWAQRLDSPPFIGYAVTCGITFTFGGLKISPDAGVLDTEDAPIPGLYAAGELVGGLFYYNYAGGSGLMAGSVFGRIAGAKASGSA